MLPFQQIQHSNRGRLKDADRLTGRKKAEVVIAIGASTGGPKALEKLFQNLPADLPAAVMVSLHMPAGFTATFADRLNQLAPLHVQEAREGDPILEGIALIAPGGYHLIQKKRLVSLDRGPKVHYVRPAVDVMLESLADSSYKVIAAILTGMGRDGTAGTRNLKQRKPGSIVIVQDPQTSTMPGMPQSVISGGFYDETVPLPDMAARIVKHTRELVANRQLKDVQR